MSEAARAMMSTWVERSFCGRSSMTATTTRLENRLTTTGGRGRQDWIGLDLLSGTGVATALRIVQWPTLFLNRPCVSWQGWLFQGQVKLNKLPPSILTVFLGKRRQICMNLNDDERGVKISCPKMSFLLPVHVRTVFPEDGTPTNNKSNRILFCFKSIVGLETSEEKNMY